MIKTKILLLLFLTAFVFKSFSQDEKLISENDIIKLVQENNIAQKITEQDFLKSKADYQQTNAVFLPNITASYSGLITTNPLMAFGSKLNQGIIQVSDFDPNQLNNPSQTTNYATILKFEQPLVNMDGIYQRKAAKNAMLANELQVQRKSEYLSFEAARAYQELQLSYKALSVIEQALDAAEKNYKVGQDFFAQGLIKNTDLLLMEIHLTELKNELLSAKSNIKNASNYISFITNQPETNIYKPNSELLLPQNESMAPDAFNISEDRADIKSMQMATAAAENQFKADKMSFLPRLNAFGSYEMYNDEIFNAGNDGYLVGAQLSWNLFEGSKRIGKTNKSKASLEASKLEYEQYMSQSNLELNKASRRFEDAKNKLTLSNLAVKQSEESLRIINNRFNEGLEKTSDVLVAETLFAKKQLEYYQTIFEYNYAKSYLDFLTK